MQTAQENAADATPFSTPLPSGEGQLPSPTTNNAPDYVDPLVAHAADKLAAVINDLKRELDKRDGTSAETTGFFNVTLRGPRTMRYTLSIVQDADGIEYPITVDIAQTKDTTANGNGETSDSAIPRTPYTATRRASDLELESDIVSRRKRKRDNDEPEDDSQKRPRTDDDDEDIMPLVTREDLDELFIKLRDDIQEDTSECVNHVQKLLRRFKEEWHEKCKWEYDQFTAIRSQPPAGRFPGPDRSNSVAGAGASFPSPERERDDSGSLQDFIRRETKLLSSQIRWVEECRRIAADAHDKREETWRTSSASFHDRNRQDREAFQARVLHDIEQQGRLMNQVLNEVKGLSNVTMSLKWETPDQLGNHPIYPPPPMAPAFPTQAAPTPRLVPSAVNRSSSSAGPPSAIRR